MFGISNNVRNRVVRTCTPELFAGVVDSSLVAKICAEIEDALEQMRSGGMSKKDFDTFKAEHKKMLPVFTPHATFKNGRRLSADAVPSGLSMYDKDHINNPRGYYASKIQGREKELGVVLAHVTPSIEGVRLFFIIPAGKDLAEAQKWMSQQLGDSEYDGAVKDLARCSFAVPRDYILYMDEEGLFADHSPLLPPDKGNQKETSLSGKNENGNGSKETTLSDKNENRNGSKETTLSDKNENENGSKETTLSDKNENGSGSKETTLSDKNENGNGSKESDANLCFKGVPYELIIRHWLVLTGGDPETGERNTRLHRLAAHLRYITDSDENLLLRIIPRYGLTEDEMRGLIHSACSAKFCSTPKEMKQAVNEASRIKAGANPSGCCPGDALLSTPPEMPQRLPALVKLLLSRTPEVYRPAVAHAVFPSLATHLHRVRFRYIDNVEHEATLMNVLMAGTGAGKDCVSQPINRIMADIRARDEANLKREREWKNEVNSKGSNKDKRQRPEGLVIQEIDADMTNPAFVMRSAEADGHFLYTKMNEIDQFDALRGGGRGQQQFQIMCLSFDPGNRYGQTRVGTQSVTEKVTIRFNWNAATTILKGQRYFSGVLTDGPISRINFCTIPEREIGADMPIYGTYDAAFDEQLRPYIANLCRATGLTDCPEAFKLAGKLKEECAEFARLSQSRVYENLSFRATVIAWLKACVLYVAAGCQWDKTIEDFTRWSLRYDLWCKMEFFGTAIEEAGRNTAARERHTPGRRNLLELLPDEFTRTDAVRVRQTEGMDAEGTDLMLRQWKFRGYVTIVTNDNYKKLKYKSSWK